MPWMRTRRMKKVKSSSIGTKDVEKLKERDKKGKATTLGTT